jgi:hypothetical protein
MRHPMPWLFLVVGLLGALFLREPQLREIDDLCEGWFLAQSDAPLPPAHVTLIEITRQDFSALPVLRAGAGAAQKTAAKKTLRRTVSPLEYALFLQAAMEFQPAVIALEPIVIWRDRDKDQEQVFLDQAMRVPKLLVAMQLGEKGPRDLSADDLPTFPQVSGPRADLPEFPGIAHRPDDDIRLISTTGFTNLSGKLSERIRVPMIFEYRGEIVPSFALEAIILWLRATPADVKIELGKQVDLPNGWEIPLGSDGTTAINPRAADKVRRLSLNQLILAAQERENHHAPTIDLSKLKDEIVVLRIADDPLQPPKVFATAIATIQENAYVRRAPPACEWTMVGLAALASFFLWRISKGNLFLLAIALSAGYSLITLEFLDSHRLWLPFFLPLALLWLLVAIRLLTRGAPAK